MDVQLPVDVATSQAWARLAHSARWLNHFLPKVGDPAPTSNFVQVNGIYPYEKASDWHRSYLSAALEHLMIWADMVAPLKFHPEQRVTHTFRPAYTLARAAIEASSQAVWMTSGGAARECARRHLALIRWDYEEHRKSVSSAEDKARISQLDVQLLQRTSGIFAEGELGRPNHFTVLKEAAPVISVDPDDLTGAWRAASGAAHGKVWPSLALQHVIPLGEYEPGQERTMRFPDAAKMTGVLETADKMITYGVLRHAYFCGADIPRLMEETRLWLASVVPLREDADPEVLAHLTRRESGPPGQGARSS